MRSRRNIKSYLVIVLLLLTAQGLSAQCSAGFTFPAVSCQFNKAQFTFSGNAGQPKFSWNFGDPGSGAANTDTIANPLHLFNTPGIFSVTLIISDTGGCRDTLIKSIRILKKPEAAYTVAQTCAGLGTPFYSYSYKDTFDRFQSYQWTFGDGGSDTAALPIHVYTTYGNMTTTLILTTKYGCKDTAVVPIPIFDFVTSSIDKDSACIGDLVNFSINPGATPGTNYQWNFGDASTSSSQNTSHQYNTSGKFTPVATVTYWNGFSCAVKHTAIKIHPQPDPGFTLLDSIQCYKNNSICVKLKQHGNSLTYSSFSFDDGFVDYTTAFTDSIICHTYTDTSGGKYILSLNIIDKNKCSASSVAKSKVTIYPKLQAGISSSNVTGCFKTPFLPSILPIRNHRK